MNVFALILTVDELQEAHYAEWTRWDKAHTTDPQREKQNPHANRALHDWFSLRKHLFSTMPADDDLATAVVAMIAENAAVQRQKRLRQKELDAANPERVAAVRVLLGTLLKATESFLFLA